MVETGVSAAGRERLLERERELASLDDLVRQAGAGNGRLVIVEGPAGIGKTRLLAAARRRGEELGLRVLAARGGEHEREFAFGVVRQLFEPVLADAEARKRALRGAAASAATVFEAPEDGSESTADPSFAVLHGLFWLTVNLSAERPLLLSLDDLHWCDHASLRYVAYLVRRLEGLPVVVVAGLRSAEPGVDTALLAELGSDSLTAFVRPAALSGAAARELVRERLGDSAADAFAAACATATGGNPLLLSELLKALEAEGVQPVAENVGVVNELGPRAASRAILLRLSRLDDETRAAARAIAVLGDGADPRTVAALAGVDEQRAARSTDELTRAELVRPDPPVGFVHPLVGAAVYHDIPPGERTLLHERAVALLVDAGASVERVAAHLLSIPPRADASTVDVLRRAGRDAVKKGAAESAVAYLQRALAEPPPDEARIPVLLELGQAEALTSGPQAAEHLREAYATIPDPLARGQLAPLLAGALLFTGRPHEGAEVAREAAAALPAEHRDLGRSLEAFALGAALFGAGEYEQFPSPDAAAETNGGIGAKMLTALASLRRAYACAPLDESVGLSHQAIAGGELIAADPGGIPTMATVIVLAWADRDEALAVLDQALAGAHRSGSVFGVAGVRIFRGYTLLMRGELAEARDELETAIEVQRTWGYGPGALVYPKAFLGATLVESGDLAGARRVLPDEDEPQVVTDGGRFWLNSKLALLAAEGRLDEAVRVADVLRERYSHVLLPAAGHWRSLAAEALDRLGRVEEARALAAEELELARQWGAPRSVGRALCVLGTLERDEGIERLREAVDVLTGSPARLQLAQALAALGSALRRSRRPSDAREPLRRALELADVCGAAGLGEHVRSELYATGARPRTTALSGVDALTASERRVAALAADGQTNRDIAQALYVTPKTVEVHLTNAYRKLGIRSRRELPAAFAGA